MKRYRISEIFHSAQGEGRYTGAPSIFLRFWGCNFQCRGFGGEPAPHVNVDRLADFPVAETGCDTEYAWNPAYRHLSETLDAEAICDRIMELVPAFRHPDSGQWTHLVVTGGEPMLSQSALADVLDTLAARGNLPAHLTVETNGTQPPRPPLDAFIASHYAENMREWFWSASPKLGLSGEAWEEAIRPDVLAAYAKLSPHGQLKLVTDGSDAGWDDVARARDVFRAAGIDWEITIMPVGATRERLEATQTAICTGALARGYRFSPRLHAWLFGNAPGT